MISCSSLHVSSSLAAPLAAVASSGALALRGATPCLQDLRTFSSGHSLASIRGEPKGLSALLATPAATLKMHATQALCAPSHGISRGFAAHAQPVSPDHASKPVQNSSTTSADGSSARLFGEGGYVAPHPGMRGPSHVQQVTTVPGELPESFMEHPTYNLAYLESIKPIHRPPADAADRMGLAAVRLMRGGFDRITGYGPNMTEAKWLQRIIFLETVAGVPGMVAGMLRHLNSLRRMKRDAGWIHCLLEEAENERMHLMTFMEMRRPGPLLRATVLLTQGIFFNAYFIAYLLWPKACHAFVGYLEEEAVRTYTHAVQDIDAGKVWANMPAPPIAQSYWKLPAGATMRDLVLVVRADEACHSHVNHTLKGLRPDEPNPFALGKSQLP